MKLNLPFRHYEKQEKKVYEMTFLTRVSIKVFLPEDYILPSREQFDMFFRDLFGIVRLPDLQYDKLLHSKLKIKNEDTSISVTFSKTDIKLLVEQNSYKSFGDSISPLLTKILLSYPNLSKVRGFKIKKINVWPIVTSEPVTEAQVEELRDAVLTPVLRENSTQVEDSTFTYSIYNNENRDSSSEILDIVYGTIAQKRNEDTGEDKNFFGGLVLENTVIEKKELLTEQVIEVADQANDLLYDAFHWAVEPNIIEYMIK